MIVYPLMNTTGQVIGRIALENNEIPDLIVSGEVFTLSGDFYPKSGQFINFVLVPLPKVKKE